MYSQCSRIQKAQDDRGLVCRHAYQRCYTAQLSRPHHMLTIAWFECAMFGIKNEKVPALISQYFNKARVHVTDEAAKDCFASFEFRFGAICAHSFSLQ